MGCAKAIAEHFACFTGQGVPGFLTTKVDQLIPNKDVFILERLATQIFKAWVISPLPMKAINTGH